MPLPEPKFLSLPEAADRAARRCAVSTAAVVARLELAIRHRELLLVNDKGNALVDHEIDQITMNWRTGLVETKIPGGGRESRRLRMARQQLDDWTALAQPRLLYTPQWKVLGEAAAYISVAGNIWHPVALENLFAALRDGAVKARYRRSRNPVPPSHWDLPAINPVHLHTSDNTEIEVSLEDLEKVWPSRGLTAEGGGAVDADARGPEFGDPPENAGSRPTNTDAIYNAGTAGRPTSWHLVKPEFERRWKDGERHIRDNGVENLNEWATVLAAWLADTHPTAPSMKNKALGNQLRPLLRNREAAAEPPPKITP